MDLSRAIQGLAGTFLHQFTKVKHEFSEAQKQISSFMYENLAEHGIQRRRTFKISTNT